MERVKITYETMFSDTAESGVRSDPNPGLKTRSDPVFQILSDMDPVLETWSDPNPDSV